MVLQSIPVQNPLQSAEGRHKMQCLENPGGFRRIQSKTDRSQQVIGVPLALLLAVG